MMRLEYLLQSFLKGLYKDAFFIKSIFSIFETNATEDYLVRKDNQGYYFIKDNEKVYFEDGKDTTKPLISYKERIVIPAGVIANHPEQLITTTGRLLQNFLLTTGPFGKKVPYFNKVFLPPDVEAYIDLNWTRPRTEVTAENPEKENEIFTEDYLTYANNALFLSNFDSMVVPSITTKTLQTNPALEKRKKELLLEFANDLDNPSTIAKIDAELIKLDKEYLKGDPSMGFLINGKDFNIVRKKLMYYFGITTGLSGVPKFVEKPLKDGMDTKDYPHYVNDAFSGSIGRGLDTQNGGVAVSNAIRAGLSLRVDLDNEDCGSKLGELIKIPTGETASYHYIGFNYIENGKNLKIEKDNLESLRGKTLLLRSPAYCAGKEGTFCKTCVGPHILRYPDGLMTANAKPGSRIMGISMKSMHGKALTTIGLEISELFS